MYDIIIIGCGPAGMTSAIYALRANKKVLILESEGIGGQIASSPLVENYPGFKQISGSELSNNLYEQVVNLGGIVELETVIEIKDGTIKEVITEDNKYTCKSIIVATGSKHRLLGLNKEEEFIGNGISFCVSCDGAFYKNKIVAVIGGGNSAIINALALSELCKKVFIIQNLENLTAEKTLVDRLNTKKNVEIICNSNVKELLGDEELEGIIINSNNIDKKIELDGMFISIGLIPQTDIIKDLLKLNNYRYIESNDDCATNVAGIFVAGDCRNKKIRQLTTAISDGTIAAISAINYLDK